VTRTYLSPREVGIAERQVLRAAIEPGWVAPTGPDPEAFDVERGDVVGRRGWGALSSGTAALHLALLAVGVEAGTKYWSRPSPFVASANAVGP
jgi:dTDP-4-amino-4,6-dideoxygalactose transaminase